MNKNLGGKRNVNWHEAATCALQIELRDYSHLLDFYTEYVLGKNRYRIDLLIIHKFPDTQIPKNIAKIFNTYNLFEIKGLGSSLTTDSYYKTNGYAGLLINSSGKKNQYTRLNVSLSFLSSHYPRKLFRHLTEDCKLTLEKSSPGIYHIKGEMYRTQVLVISKLPPEENLYLRCLCRNFGNPLLSNRLADDYKSHQDEDVYIRYMEQLTRASINSKGESPMVCEGILNICGTSTKEIEERTKAIYLPQIESLNAENSKLSSENFNLSSEKSKLIAEIAALKARLAMYEKE